MLKRLSLLTAFLAAPLAAEPTDQQRAAINALWDQMRAEQRVFVTCYATADWPQGNFIEETLSQMVLDAGRIMREAGFSEAEIAAQTTISTPRALRMADDTPFGEVRALCQSNQGYDRQYKFINFMLIDRAIEEALGQ